MGRRSLGMGFMVLASSMLLMAGSASAHRTARPQAEEPKETSQCLVKSLPSFTAQGEFDTNSSIADVIEVECNPVLSEA